MDDVTRRRALLVAVLVILVVLAGIGFARGRHGDGAGARASDRHRVRVARHGVTAATLDVVGGTDGLTVTDGGTGGDLATAQTPAGSRVVPYTDVSGSQLTVGTRGGNGADHTGPALLTVRLDPSVAWTVRIDGGTARLRLQLRGPDLRALYVDQGVSVLELDVGRPRATTDVHVSGGASTVRVRLPAGTATRYTFSGGAGSATIGSARHGGLAGGATFTSPGFATARDRVDVHLDSGIGSLSASA